MVNFSSVEGITQESHGFSRVECQIHALNTFAKVPVWDVWQNKRPNASGKIKSEMWHHYRAELFPHTWGIYAGPRIPNGPLIKFDEFFRIDRDGIEKGLVKLKKG